MEMSAKIMKRGTRSIGWLGLAAILLFAFASVQAQDAERRQLPAPTNDLQPSFNLHQVMPGVTDAPSSVGQRGAAKGGGKVFAGVGREVILNSLPQLVSAPSKVGQEPENDRPLNGLTDEQYLELKHVVGQRLARKMIGSLPSTQAKNAQPAGSTSAVHPFSVGIGGFYAQGMIGACGGCVPSDMALGVGTNFVVQIVNSAIAVYDKKGNLQSGFPKAAAPFFGLASGTYTTDPRLVYDWTYHRWIAIMLTETSPSSGTNTGSLLIAVSQGQDPRLGWWTYSFQVGSAGECPDYPTFGQDSNNWGPGATKGGFYIGINQFSGSGHCSGSSFAANYVFFIPKDSVYSGGGLGYWYFYGLNFGGTQVDTLEPANMTDRADRPSAIFLVDSKNMMWGGGVCSTGCNGIDIWTVNGPATAPFNPFAFLDGTSAGPTLSGITIASAHNYSLPPLAASPGCQAGSGPCVDTNDTRISGQVKYHAGSLFGSFNTGVAVSPAVAGPIWFEIHPILSNSTGAISSASERQEDCFLCGGWSNNGSAWFATLQPDPENNVLMGFEYSTDAVYPSTVITSRRVTYGDSLMNGAGVYLVSGSAQYPYGRWGDYTATAPDLTIANQPIMWFSGMYADPSGYWGTAVGYGQYNVPGAQ